jgi:hypothetical protein
MDIPLPCMRVCTLAACVRRRTAAHRLAGSPDAATMCVACVARRRGGGLLCGCPLPAAASCACSGWPCQHRADAASAAAGAVSSPPVLVLVVRWHLLVAHTAVVVACAALVGTCLVARVPVFFFLHACHSVQGCLQRLPVRWLCRAHAHARGRARTCFVRW